MTGFKLVKQKRFAQIYGHNVEKGLVQAKNEKCKRVSTKLHELIWLSFAN